MQTHISRIDVRRTKPTYFSSLQQIQYFSRYQIVRFASNQIKFPKKTKKSTNKNMISIWLIKMLRCWMRKNTQKKTTNVENWIFLSLDFSRFVSIAQDWQYGTRCKFVAATAHLAGRPYRARRMPVCVSVRCKPLPPLCDCECGWQAASDVVYERCFVVIARRIEPIRVTGCCLCQFGCVGAGMRSIHTHTLTHIRCWRVSVWVLHLSVYES